METITLVTFIAICLIYIGLITFCAYYCSDYRKPFFWEKESINNEMDELLKEEVLEENSDKIYYDSL
tara:strand:- start:72 stop:272 length:201 start_codon:yes stop_codon:yes gene_type:complete